uniref:P2Y purinoceptor 1-like n=1 Tax=Sander lucioperca TaxID=283035 RepID=A0A8C9XB29_SANLU
MSRCYEVVWGVVVSVHISSFTLTVHCTVAYLLQSICCFSGDRMKNTSFHRISFEFTAQFLPPVYILVFIIGLVANGWGLNSLLHKWKKLKIINVSVLNLGLADILYLLTLPFLVVYYFKKRKWIFGDAFCKITRFCFNLNLYGSIGFLTCISVYRYLAIVHPVRVMGRLTLTHSVGISVMVWFLVSVQSLPDMFYSKTFGNNTEKCFDTTSDIYVDDYIKYSLGWTFTGFCIPLLITLGCYGHVIVVLCRTNTTDKVLKQKSFKLLFIVILLFSVCYIPYHVLKNLNLWSRVLQNQKICREWSNGVYIAHQISRGLVCLNSALNPLVYLHGNEDIPAQLRRRLQQARQMFSRPPPTNSVGVPMAQITDGGYRTC